MDYVGRARYIGKRLSKESEGYGKILNEWIFMEGIILELMGWGIMGLIVFRIYFC